MNPKAITLAALAGVALLTAPARAALIAYDNFNTYLAGPAALNGQYGVPGANLVGFAGSPASGKQWVGNTAVVVTGGVLNQGANLARTRRAFATTPLVGAGTIYVRAALAMSSAPSGGNFSALELAPTLNADTNTVRLTGADGGLSINANGSGGVSSAVIGPASSAMHIWLIELNLDTKAGKVWLDPTLGGFDPDEGGFSFTAPTGFALNGINVATFGGNSFVQLDDFWIGTTLSDVGVTVIPEPSAAVLGGLGLLALLRRRHR